MASGALRCTLMQLRRPGPPARGKVTSQLKASAGVCDYPYFMDEETKRPRSLPEPGHRGRAISKMGLSSVS